METWLAGPGQRVALLGRADECAALSELLAAIRGGSSRSLVLWGEPGIGKTALLAFLVESASDLRVLRAAGVESEMELAYASLHLLCGPLLDRLSALPAPQRRALEIVFSLSDGPAPDRLLVGLAALSLLAEAGDECPLLCVIDDAQWLDHASALILAFVARRLLAERVGIVFAARERGEELRHLPDLEVGPLRPGDARELLGSAARLTLDSQVRDQFLVETHGNPLALLELPRGLSAAQLAGGFGLVAAQPLSGQLEQSFVRRRGSLSEDAQRLLLLAAAEPLGDPLLLLRAAEQLGIAVSDVYAETDGLLALGARVTFRHPLVRSAVYRTAPAAERRAVHLALAQATDAMLDPDRRAWHLASAAVEVDEQVALELERSADRARARGGLAASAAFLDRAVALTGDPARRADRALAAAEANLQAGAFDAALGLLATAQASRLDALQRARADLVRGHVAFASGLGGDAPPLLLKAAASLKPFDLDLARETYLTAWGAAVFAGSAGGDVMEEICRAVRGLPPSPGPRPLETLLEGFALLTAGGRPDAVPVLRRAARELTSIPVEDVLRWGWAATGASDAVWDDERTRMIAERNVQLVREAGVLAELPIHLAALALAKAWIGDFAGVEALIAESESVAAATGSPIAPYAMLRLRTLQGSEAEASIPLAIAMERATSGQQGLAANWAHWSAAVLYNGLGRYAEAASEARQATSNTYEPWASTWALPELVEAAARAGAEEEHARDALERLVETTQPSATDFALGIEARSRALLSHGAAAEDLYCEAIDRLSRTELRPELGRAHLLYGEWLRREQRRVDARAQLRAAHTLFRSIGMEAFDERTRRELLATGEKVRQRTVETRDELTEQERQIARLAGDGLSNAEIGGRLFLSPRTVEWHLRKVFTKLGIRSRRELLGALTSSGSELLPV